MHSFGEHRTGALFDPFGFLDLKRRQILDQGWAGTFRTKILLFLPVHRVAAELNAVHGRPTKDLYIMLGTLILQQMHDMTDAAAVEAVAFNIAWQYALDIRSSEDAYVSERTIRNYRALVIEHGLDQVLFRTLTDHLMEVYKVDATHQRIDSTALQSAMRRLSRLGVFTETIERFLRKLSQKFPDDYCRLDEVIRVRYLDGGKGMCFGAGSKPSEAARHLDQAAEDLLDLIERFAGTPAAELPGYKLMQRVLDEQCQVKPGGGHKVVLKEKADGRSLQNPSDPGSTYNAHKGQGYTMQVMETYVPDEPATPPGPDADATTTPVDDSQQPQAQEPEQPLPPKPDLITFVAVNGMPDYDGNALVPAIEETAARGIVPEELLGDTHYGTGNNPQAAAEHGVELISPAQPPKGSLQGNLQLEDFGIDDDGLVVTCPAGRKPISLSVSPSGKNYQARFDADACANCSLRPTCPVQDPRPSDPKACRVQYDRPRLDMYRRRLGEKKPEFQQRYRWRAGIEATMSRLKHVLGMGALRVRGLAAVTYEAFMGALSLNIMRCAAAR
jgi:hypothetical protein